MKTMIKRRVKEFWKSAIFLVTVRLAENDDSEASDSVFANWPSCG